MVLFPNEYSSKDEIEEDSFPPRPEPIEEPFESCREIGGRVVEFSADGMFTALLVELEEWRMRMQ